MRTLYVMDLSSCLCTLVFLLRNPDCLICLFRDVGYVLSPVEVARNGDP